MSWNEHISSLEKSGGVTKAAIMGQDGSTWAITEGWRIEESEVKALMAGLSNSAAFQESGVTVAGVRYIFIGGTQDFIRAKKGQTGLHVSKTEKALIVGYYEDPIQPGKCSQEVEKFADYLKGLQY